MRRVFRGRRRIHIELRPREHVTDVLPETRRDRACALRIRTVESLYCTSLSQVFCFPFGSSLDRNSGNTVESSTRGQTVPRNNIELLEEAGVAFQSHKVLDNFSTSTVRDMSGIILVFVQSWPQPRVRARLRVG